jgi:hypothetical protein
MRAVGLAAMLLVSWCGHSIAEGPRVSIPVVRSESDWSDEERAVRLCLDYWTKLATSRNYEGYGFSRGWPSRLSPNQMLRFGESGQPIPRDVVCVKTPGSPMVGRMYLNAYRVLGEPRYLKAAKEVGNLLLAGQTKSGGWGVELWMGPSQANSIRTFPGMRSWPEGDPLGVVRGNDVTDLVDATTLDAMEFLYQLWWVSEDRRYRDAWESALDCLSSAQKAAGGGIPESFPADDFRARASFFGGTGSAAARALQMGYERTGEPRFLKTLIRYADWVVSVKKPGQGWGMRYDRAGNPAGGQAFEPPGLSTLGTQDALQVLGIAYPYTADEEYIGAIKDAVVWLNVLPTGQGVYANYYHPGTNVPWFRDGAGQDVRTHRRARLGYPWIGSWGREAISLGNQLASSRYRTGRRVPAGGDPSARALPPVAPPGGPGKGMPVERILQTQNRKGVWPIQVEGATMLTVRSTYHKVLKLCAAVARQRGLTADGKSPPASN